MVEFVATTYFRHLSDCYSSTLWFDLVDETLRDFPLQIQKVAGLALCRFQLYPQKETSRINIERIVSA